MKSLWQRWFGSKPTEATDDSGVPKNEPATKSEVRPLDIAPNDPLLSYINSSPGVIDLSRLNIESPTVDALRREGAKIVVPLVSQGELIGLLNLGNRMSEQEYTSDDLRLLNTLATQAAPAFRIAQLARQQLAEAQERQRMEQELRVGRVIQETLLPREIPQIAGWHLATHWKPAREVGGDFYDFVPLPDNRLGIIIADVTDKGVPAAMVMATTRSLLRAAAERLVEPGKVLERANELLYPDIPPKMFVTCHYATLDPATGHVRYANAGHDLPYHRHKDGANELRAKGMPLGLMPGMQYEEKELFLEPGDTILLYSDGLVEAHNSRGDMFSFPRLAALMAQHQGGEALIKFLLEELLKFTGDDWEQEDDVTMVIIQRAPTAVGADDWHVVATFEWASAPGNERQAMQDVANAVGALGLPALKLDRLKTAVAETTMNAMEHGNSFNASLPVQCIVRANNSALSVSIIDQGGGRPMPVAETPDLDAKLAGLQTARGWGLFLIEKMVDKVIVNTVETTHTVELIVKLGEDSNG